MFLSSSSVAC